MNRSDRFDFENGELYKRDFFRMIKSLVYMQINLIYSTLTKLFFTITDFLFKRYFWYRKRRKTYSVRIMPICYGDARNHSYSKWFISKYDTDDEWAFRVYLRDIQKKYFILEVWINGEKLDIVERFKIDSNKLKKYNREEKLNNLLK